MRITDNRGFTLIDLSVALIVIGLIMVPALRLHQIKQARADFLTTGDRLFDIREATSNFYYANNRYPCPANITKTAADDDYGAEDCTIVPNADGITRGGVPFIDLQIPPSATLDRWSRKITYVVTNDLTVAPLNPVGGRILVTGLDGDGLAKTYAAGAHLMLVSHGENGLGAFTANGKLFAACLTGADATRESPNCDGGRTYFNSLFARSLSNTDSNYYDDITVYQDGLPNRIWVYSRDDDTDILSNVPKVGIGTNSPDFALDVNGNIKTENGNANTLEICAQDGSNCFSAQVIGGTGIDCNDPNTAMTGIENSDTLCEVTRTATGISGGCPSTQFMVGINNAGVIQCCPGGTFAENINAGGTVISCAP